MMAMPLPAWVGQSQAAPRKHRRIPSSAAEEVCTFGVVSESCNPCEQDPSGRFVRYPLLLGRGACKRVFRAFDCEFGQEVAWNQVQLSGVEHTENALERLFEEIHVLQQLHHKNIMSFMSYWYNPKLKTINFITELFQSGTLRQYRRKVCAMNENILKRWAWQILEGLVYLHGHDPPIVHRDLKCDNIFVNGNTGQIKIGDLGYATAQQELSVVGTPEFMAPEIYDEQYDHKVDIYSFGMVLLELATLEFPYSECHGVAQIFRKVSQGIKPQALQRVLSEPLRCIIELCIAHEPAARPEARELLKHPYFAQPRAEQGCALNASGSRSSSCSSLTVLPAAPGGTSPPRASPSRLGKDAGAGAGEASPRGPPAQPAPAAAAPVASADSSQVPRSKTGTAPQPPDEALGPAGPQGLADVMAGAGVRLGVGGVVPSSPWDARKEQGDGKAEAGSPSSAQWHLDSLSSLLPERRGPSSIRQHRSVNLSELAFRLHKHDGVGPSGRDPGPEGVDDDSDAMSESSDEVVVIPLHCLTSMDSVYVHASADGRLPGTDEQAALGHAPSDLDPDRDSSHRGSVLMLSCASSLMTTASPFARCSELVLRTLSMAPRRARLRASARTLRPVVSACTLRTTVPGDRPVALPGCSSHPNPMPLSPGSPTSSGFQPHPAGDQSRRDQDWAAAEVSGNPSATTSPSTDDTSIHSCPGNIASLASSGAPSAAAVGANAAAPCTATSGAAGDGRAPSRCPLVKSDAPARPAAILPDVPMQLPIRAHDLAHSKTEPLQTAVSQETAGHLLPPTPSVHRHRQSTPSSPRPATVPSGELLEVDSSNSRRPIHGVIVRIKQCKGQGFCPSIQKDPKRLRRATTM